MMAVMIMNLGVTVIPSLNHQLWVTVFLSLELSLENIIHCLMDSCDFNLMKRRLSDESVNWSITRRCNCQTKNTCQHSAAGGWGVVYLSLQTLNTSIHILY